MNRQERVAGLFAAAMEIETDRQAEFLRAECGADAGLLEELKELLAAFHHPKAAAFLSQSALELEAEYLANDENLEIDSRPGQILGHYQILKKIGAGGMGIIYLAARIDDFEKQAAVKIIKRGMDTDAILRRFRNERQILANLEHPNIARLIDGGTTGDGLPYLVMEFIEGVSIDDYCSAHNLDTSARLKLFRTVCAAVAFAHRNLIIHRDLKPSNILVIENGEPKLLDFGIAKLLTEPDADTVTQANMRVSTPAYASPEQFAGEIITTAADVYSLGVVLQELLTGERPPKFKLQPSGSNSKTESPHFKDQKPKTKNQLLNTDLRNIIAKALRREPVRRYASVEYFSDDILRYLNGLPITARADTFSYRAEKFIKRNKIGVALAIFVFLLLIGSTAGILWQNSVARAERARAERRFNDVRALVNAFLSQLNDEMAKVSGTTAARRLLVRQTLEYLNNASRETGDDVALEHELATAYVKVGDIQGNSYYQNLGDTTGALASYRKALEIYQRLAAKNPADKEIKSEFAQTYKSIGDVLWDTGDLKATLENYNQATKFTEDLSKDSPEDVKTKLLLAQLYAALGDIKYDEGFQSFKDMPASFEELHKALNIREQLSAADPENTEIEIALNQSYQRLANNYRLAGDFAREFDFLQKSEAIVKKLLTRDPENPTRKREAAIGDARFVTYFIDAEELEKAGEYNQKSLALRNAGYQADKINARAQRDLAFGYLINGNLLMEKEDFRAALESYQKQLKLYEDLAALDAANQDRRRDLVDGLINVGNALLKTDDAKSALANFNRATEISRTFPPEDLQTRINLAFIYEGTGSALRLNDKTIEAAKENFQKAIELRETQVKSDSMNSIALAELAKTYLEAGKTFERSDRRTALDLYQKSIDGWSILKTRNALRATDQKAFEETRQALSKITSIQNSN